MLINFYRNLVLKQFFNNSWTFFFFCLRGLFFFEAYFCSPFRRVYCHLPSFEDIIWWERLLSLTYNGSRCHLAFGVKSTLELHLGSTTAAPLSRNHDPVTQDNPQTLFLVVSCRKYFISARRSERAREWDGMLVFDWARLKARLKASVFSPCVYSQFRIFVLGYCSSVFTQVRQQWQQWRIAAEFQLANLLVHPGISGP